MPALVRLALENISSPHDLVELTVCCTRRLSILGHPPSSILSSLIIISILGQSSTTNIYNMKKQGAIKPGSALELGLHVT